jgi:hypothetical protein
VGGKGKGKATVDGTKWKGQRQREQPGIGRNEGRERREVCHGAIYERSKRKRKRRTTKWVE